MDKHEMLDKPWAQPPDHRALWYSQPGEIYIIRNTLMSASEHSIDTKSAVARAQVVDLLKKAISAVLRCSCKNFESW